MGRDLFTLGVVDGKDGIKVFEKSKQREKNE